ncbi:carbohydrate ABC transporter permease [Bradyrhizobium iriomotense]|uniref:Sugar ABC transporter permease n=1 Tax=Bradyrhizobium iriomotense TaxID=441950 RepID=A0ABQ6ATV9_9BRAD|nr:sugar ABC transporter permease [Bradyrhizobium iriomotense]GLR84661.1 sugar ABC transporter permease [Bradyrhizobium iriomotense]
MTATTEREAATGMTRQQLGPSLRGWLQDWLPRLVLAPSFLLVLVFVYGFNLWTVFLSFTNSRAFPTTNLIGFTNYVRLWNWTFETDPPSNWYTALVNMGLFGGLYIFFCLFLGLLLAILLDQKIRGEGILRPIYLYPLALSFIVTGTAWKLFLDPRIGLENALHDWGWISFHFDWVVDPKMMIYCVAIAGIWQSSGFVMAMFLAGLRGVDGEILKAAQIDGASAYQTYRRIVIPIIRPVFFSALIVLAHMAIKSYDLVLSVTGKNPGGAAELPSTFMYSYTFTRNQMAVGSASAVIMLMTIAAIMVPYIYSETREKSR